MLDSNKLCMSSMRFYYSSFKIVVKNNKLCCTKISYLLNGNLKYTPKIDNKLGQMQEDYQVTEMSNIIRNAHKKDNFIGCPLALVSQAMHLFSPYSPFPSNHFACLSAAILKTSDKEILERKQTHADDIQNNITQYSNDNTSLQGLSNNKLLKRQKVKLQD